MHGITILVVRLQQDGATATTWNISPAMTKASCRCFIKLMLINAGIFTELIQKITVGSLEDN
jgi:hypothetical protein